MAFFHVFTFYFWSWMNFHVLISIWSRGRHRFFWRMSFDFQATRWRFNPATLARIHYSVKKTLTKISAFKFLIKGHRSHDSTQGWPPDDLCWFRSMMSSNLTRFRSDIAEFGRIFDGRKKTRLCFWGFVYTLLYSKNFQTKISKKWTKIEII